MSKNRSKSDLIGKIVYLSLNASMSFDAFLCVNIENGLFVLFNSQTNQLVTYTARDLANKSWYDFEQWHDDIDKTLGRVKQSINKEYAAICAKQVERLDTEYYSRFIEPALLDKYEGAANESR
jgi:hypothetical protein